MISPGTSSRQRIQFPRPLTVWEECPFVTPTLPLNENNPGWQPNSCSGESRTLDLIRASGSTKLRASAYLNSPASIGALPAIEFGQDAKSACSEHLRPKQMWAAYHGDPPRHR